MSRHFFFTHSLTHSVFLYTALDYCRKSLWLNLNFFSRLFTSKFIINMRKMYSFICLYVCEWVSVYVCINMRLIMLLLVLPFKVISNKRRTFCTWSPWKIHCQKKCSVKMFRHNASNFSVLFFGCSRQTNLINGKRKRETV